MDELAVIGGGPAGLRVCQVALQRGIQPHLYEQKRSVGRKLLVAGKSGLNITSTVDPASFLSQYRGTDLPTSVWKSVYEDFDNHAVRDWVKALGSDTFESSGNKVFPTEMKAAPLLRSLVKSLKLAGCHIQANTSLIRLEPQGRHYDISLYQEGKVIVKPYKRVVFAMGGGSWGQTGSDGKWVSAFDPLGVQVSPLVAANCGWECHWGASYLERYEGTPWKNIHCSTRTESHYGELVITRYGLEGGPLYRLGASLRTQSPPVMTIDFKPSLSVPLLCKKAESVRTQIHAELSRRWKLPPSVIALLLDNHPEISNAARVTAQEIEILAQAIKATDITFLKSRPLSEAISSAGGVAWSEVSPDLMLHKYPNVYVCGEMLDWEAPTGGFLLQGCLSTATRVGRAL